MKIEYKNMALEVIESICSESSTRKGLTQKEREMIYRYAHVAMFRCKNQHSDWMNELHNHFTKLKKANII